MAEGSLVGLDADTLGTLKTQFTAALAACAVGGQSYSISGRQLTRADLPEIRKTIEEINYALGLLNNTVRTRSVAGFGSPYA